MVQFWHGASRVRGRLVPAKHKCAEDRPRPLLSISFSSPIYQSEETGPMRQHQRAGTRVPGPARQFIIPARRDSRISTGASRFACQDSRVGIRAGGASATGARLAASGIVQRRQAALSALQRPSSPLRQPARPPPAPTPAGDAGARNLPRCTPGSRSPAPHRYKRASPAHWSRSP